MELDSSIAPPNPRWVDRLFARLAVRYGTAWQRMWLGIDPGAVQADWASVLGTLFERNPQALVYGLDHLPEDRPPTATAFLRLCLSAPDSTPRLAAPTSTPDPAFAESVHKRIGEASKAGAHMSQSALCAAKLRKLMADGFRLTPSQRHVLECCERQIAGLAPVEAA